MRVVRPLIWIQTKQTGVLRLVPSEGQGCAELTLPLDSHFLRSLHIFTQFALDLLHNSVYNSKWKGERD